MITVLLASLVDRPLDSLPIFSRVDGVKRLLKTFTFGTINFKDNKKRRLSEYQQIVKNVKRLQVRISWLIVQLTLLLKESSIIQQIPLVHFMTPTIINLRKSQLHLK